MAQVTRATHATDVAAKLANNTAGDISPQDIREVITDLEDSVTWHDEADVSADTTPQLGGDLDVNGNSIISASNGNITIAPNGTGDVVLDADVTEISGGLLINERADHAATPAAAHGEIWVKNDATQALMFTDDAGVDKEVLTGTSATNVATYTGVLGMNSGTAVDVNTKALLEARLTDVANLAEADGDDYTGAHDFSDATVNWKITTDADNYTLVLDDAVVRMTSGSANTLTVPTNAAVAFPTGSVIMVWSEGAGTTTIAGDTGVTLQGNGGSVSAGSCDIQTQYGAATLVKVATDTWNVAGDIDAVA